MVQPRLSSRHLAGGAGVRRRRRAVLDLLDRYGSRQKRESGRFPRWVWVPSFAAALAAFAATGEGLVLAGMSAWVVLRTSTTRNKP